MPRKTVILTTLALITSACLAQRPPERAALPDVATAVTTPPSCALIAGPAAGVHVQDVSPGPASFGILEPGDVLVTLDGAPLNSTDDLLARLSEKSPGDAVTLGTRRGEDRLELSVTLGPNPQNPDRPLMGISITTQFAEVSPGSVETLDDPGEFARMVTIDDRVFVLDPATARLGLTDYQPSETSALMVDGVRYRIDTGGTDAAILDESGRPVPISTGDAPLALLASFGPDLFLVAERAGENGIAVPVLIRASARTGTVKWAWETTETDGIPVMAAISPDGSKTLVGLVVEGATGPAYRVLDARTGAPISRPGALAQIEGGVAFGWFDSDRLVVQTAETAPSLLEFLTLASEPIALPPGTGEGTRLWAAGDGVHLLIDTGQVFGLFAVGEATEIRPLARRCEVRFVDQVGSGA